MSKVEAMVMNLGLSYSLEDSQEDDSDYNITSFHTCISIVLPEIAQSHLNGLTDRATHHAVTRDTEIFTVCNYYSLETFYGIIVDTGASTFSTAGYI